VGEKPSIGGALLCQNSSIKLGDGVALARSSEISAENNAAINIGSKVSIGPNCIIYAAASQIIIGEGTTFFSDCLISGAISIGAGCLFSKNVTVLSSTHQIYGGSTIRENDAQFRKNTQNSLNEHVHIGDDCWLGINTVILPGVTLGKGTVVGANSVVTKSYPDYSILGGVPAKLIGSRLMS
jgi:acetyltransferase-like isoleucine patch superfamily enzyme